MTDTFRYSSEQLLTGLRRHDKTMFKELYMAFSDELFLLAYRWVKDHGVAKDLVHNLFVILWDRADRININGPVRNYLYRSITNMALNELKRSARHISDDILQYASDESAFSETADYLLLQQEIIHHLQNLPPRCREIFILSRIHGLSPQEIADKFNITLNTVYYQLATALKELRTQILETDKK